MAGIVCPGDLDLDFDVDTFFADEPSLELALGISPPEAPPENTVSSSPESSVESPTSCWMNELEQFLLKEDGDFDDGENGSSPTEGFFADVFAHYDGKEERIEDSSGAEEEEVVEKNQVVDGDGRNGCGSKEENGAEEHMINKKRMRQLRNRDSAMKSRERKKIYVQNLERKSKFLEAECKRLEHLLHCCTAENIVLRNCFQKDRACGVSQARQESAALFEESLPLGSLFWFVITVFLFLAPNLLAWSLPARVKAGARGGQGVSQKLVFTGAKRSGHERLGVDLECESVFMRRRYKALKPKMKILVACH